MNDMFSGGLFAMAFVQQPLATILGGTVGYLNSHGDPGVALSSGLLTGTGVTFAGDAITSLGTFGRVAITGGTVSVLANREMNTSTGAKNDDIGAFFTGAGVSTLLTGFASLPKFGLRGSPYEMQGSSTLQDPLGLPGQKQSVQMRQSPGVTPWTLTFGTLAQPFLDYINGQNNQNGQP